MNIYVSREKKLAILVVIAIVILMMLVGAVANLILAKADMAPVYFPQVAMIQKEVRVPVYIQARLSHYWPPLGGPNCFKWDFDEQTCVSNTASGEFWEDWINLGLACPSEYEFGTVFVLPGGEEFTCVDRGGMVQTIDGIPWLDLLVASAPVPYGTVVTVEVRQ